MNKIFSCILATLGLFFGTYLLNTHVLGTGNEASVMKRVIEPSVPKYKHTRIADIQVGERVVTSIDDTPKPTQVDSTMWKKVSLFAEEFWEDGTYDTIHVQTLVPPEWFVAFDAKIGSIVPIPLDLQEMGLDEDMQAIVTAIEPCPEIRAGPGRVVLTTVNHLNPNVCELTFSTKDGKTETIRPTATHRFYSLDRNDWIHIIDAKQGERLHGLGHSALKVLSLKPTGTTERVYNMTVEEEHVYHVGYNNLLAHNTNCIALGVHEHLHDFAAQVGGETWFQWAHSPPGSLTSLSYFRLRFKEVLSDSNNKIHFNLMLPGGGMIDVPAAVSGAKSGTDTNITSWELWQISQHPEWMSRITWWNGKTQVPAPSFGN